MPRREALEIKLMIAGAWFNRFRIKSLVTAAMPGAVCALSPGRSMDLMFPSGQPGAGMKSGTALAVTLLASGALHLLVLALWLSIPARPLDRPNTRSITVDIVSPAQYQASFAPQPTPVATPAGPIEIPPKAVDPVEPVVPPAEPAPGENMVQATTYFSGAILADPANREIRDTLPLLGAEERVIQLCNIEALEQIPLWDPQYQADSLVAAAFDETRLQDLTLTASDGAFRSKLKWYHIKLICTAAPDLQSVTDFSFTVGDPVPESQWDSHNLIAEDFDDD
ncbi:DUF930 domain-containing protein [Devosia rhodophyticola]|uniref:DUF930 domain-containing protein n=1 Tax=Devosia rhodophyticola TaxID=3026423 RepID=A0ABY7YY07_9HYPH|nr:DUF930 domain-containing protein [Devosia rhodophyticola]WDR06246.1 DUF930 domain-containing protein [Devosia rhodophyticola]